MSRLAQAVRTLWYKGTGWIVPLWDRLRPAPTRYRIQMVEDLPDVLRPDLLYVVAEGGLEMQASMACPHRRCGQTLNMNLMPDDHPMWTLATAADGAPSLAPSVWRKEECGCHFWLREGRIHWC